MGIYADRVIAVRTKKTVYRDGDTALKVFDPGYSKAGVLDEARNMALAEESGLNVPQVLEVLRMEGKWAIRWEYIPGNTLERLMEEHPEKHGEYWNRFAEIQAEVFSRHAPMLNRQKDRMARRIDSAPLEGAEKAALRARLSAMPEKDAICHGDFMPANIVIKPDSAPYLLDWVHVTQGDPAADAAQTYLLLRLRGQGPAAEEYLELLCGKAKIEKEDVRDWLPLVAASQLAACRPREKGPLLRWIGDKGIKG